MTLNYTTFADLPIGEHVFPFESEDYRYARILKWSEGNSPCIFVMLNPKGSSPDKLSVTIRNCKAIAESEGHIIGKEYDGIIAVNLFAHFAYSAKNLATSLAEIGKNEEGKKALHLIEQENNRHLKRALLEPKALVIIAWGDIENDFDDGPRSDNTKELINFSNRVIGVNKIIKEHAIGKKRVVKLKYGEETKGRVELKDGATVTIAHPSWFDEGFDEIKLEERKNYYELEEYNPK